MVVSTMVSCGFHGFRKPVEMCTKLKFQVEQSPYCKCVVTVGRKLRARTPRARLGESMAYFADQETIHRTCKSLVGYGHLYSLTVELLKSIV